MAQHLHRRQFLKAGATLAAAVAAPSIWPSRLLGANERVDVAGIGVGGKGEVDVGGCAEENIVALCDVDEQNAAETFKRFPNAQRFKDYRKMLDEVKGIDAVTVSTPDHHHAPASVLAMRRGIHVYCQKPLTHTIAEARLLTDLAREKKLVTQMGNQGFSHPETRRMVELIRGGALGAVKEVHVWTDRPIWPQGLERPADKPPVPPTLDWDLWLGPAPERPYHPAYVPFKWRGWWDFGTGALGDMGCHNMGLAFFALELGAPRSVEAQSSPVNGETFPAWSIIRTEFPAPGGQGTIAMTWYDGKKTPPAAVIKGKAYPTNGIVIAGDKDALFVPNYWGGGQLLSGAKLEDFASIPQSLPRLAGADDRNDFRHHREWLDAIQGKGPKPSSSFDRAGPMTEAVLLGNLALRAGGRIEWDAREMKVTNVAAANAHVRKEYRRGWSVT